MERPDAESKKNGGAPADEGVRVAPPSQDAGQQPGFKVLEEEPKRGGSKLVWTALLVAVAILAGYYFGFFR